jgi:N-acetylmuramoyl-L-alanine amidase
LPAKPQAFDVTLSKGRNLVATPLILLAVLVTLSPCHPVTLSPNTQHRTPIAHLTICLDPGHPSEVGKGSQGKTLTEITAAWQIAQKLKHLLERDGYQVILTKTEEHQFVKNKDRANIANKSRAALLLRLHCDSGSSSGFAVYYPDRQGKSGRMRGPSKSVIEKSTEAGKLFHAAMAESLKGTLPDRGLLPDIKTLVGRKQGALTGSIYSKVPVLLVEMCDLDSATDEEFMSSEEGQRKMAEALSAGVVAAVPRSK